MLAFLSAHPVDPTRSGSTAVARPIHATRTRLLLVASQLFQQRGYHATGLAEILLLSETPKGSLYHHFPGGKSELAEACVTRIADGTVAAIDQAAESGVDIIGFLQTLARETAEWLKRTEWLDGSLLAVIGQEEGGSDSALSEAVRIAYQRIEMRLTKWLMNEGIMAARARDIAATIIASHEGALVLSRSRRDAAPVKLVANMLCMLVERG